jgi:hypothetical protein
MVFALVFLLLGVTGFYWLIVRFRERPPRPEAYEILFKRLLKKLSRLGFQKRPSEDSRAFLERVADRGFPQLEELADIVELYNGIKYGRQNDTDRSLNSMRTLIKSIEP